mgnify:CR=1 FL=1
MDVSTLDPDRQIEAKRVRRCLEDLMLAFNKSDMLSAAQHYSKTALVMLPGEIIQKGRIAVAKTCRKSLDFFEVDIEGKGWLQYEVDQILILKDDMAVTTIKSATWDTKGIPTNKFIGLGVFKKDEGDWYLHIEIFNAVED